MAAANNSNDYSLERLLAETEPALPQGVDVEIEQYVTGDGTERRVALAFLSRPWRESAEQCAEDRELCRALAATVTLLYNPIARYRDLSELLAAAQARMMAAVLSHPEGEQFLRDAGALDKPRSQ